jgi:hypothetical protein
MGKLIIGAPFIRALITAGVVPEHCTKVVIEAEVGSVTRLHYSVLGEDELVRVVAPAVVEAGATEE